MWGSSEKMARQIADGISSCGTQVQVLSMHHSDRSAVALELLNSAALIVGTPVLNSQIFPSMADVLCYLKGIRKKNLIGAAFGSYGWNGAPIDSVTKMLEEMGVEIVSPAVKSPFVPDDKMLNQCYELGVQIGQKINEKLHA